MLILSKFQQLIDLEIIFPWKVGKGTFVQAIPLPQKWTDVYPYPKIKIDLTEFIFSLKSGGTYMYIKFIQAIQSSSKVMMYTPIPPPPPWIYTQWHNTKLITLVPLKAPSPEGLVLLHLLRINNIKKWWGAWGRVVHMQFDLIKLFKLFNYPAKSTAYIHMRVIYQLMAACDSIFFFYILTC